MADFFDAIPDHLVDFIAQQHLFFTATAPESGRINLSPKGMDTFRCLDGTTVAYLDLTGSGNEASAHLAQNGRMTIMFCSFGPKPLILRLYGRGRVVRRGDPAWDELYGLFEQIPGARQVIVLDVESVQTSCGYAVPEYDFKNTRNSLAKWAAAKGPQGIEDYWRHKNRVSIDGLPAHPLTD